MTEIFRGYDQAGLDHEYNNAVKVADSALFIERYAGESAVARRDMACELNVDYGDAPGEKLDIFPADPGERAAPVQIYIHGGYWRALSKDEHSFVALGLQPHGVTTLVIDYDLMPGARMAELVRQCRNAVVWTYRNADRLGIDPARIHVCGHSAGGHLTAMVAATDWRDFADLPADVVKTACGISGLYDLEPIRLCYLQAELSLGEDEARDNSPMFLEPKSRAEMLALVGGEEGDEYFRQSSGLAEAWSGHGHRTSAEVMENLHHFNIAMALDNPASGVTNRICALMGID